MTTKQELRRLVRSSRPRQTDGAAADAIAGLRAHPRFQRARTVLLYNALPDEVPTQALIDELATEGRTVLLPRVTGNSTMELRRYTGPDDLERGAFSIMEPTGAVFTDYDAIDVAVVPGVAFDAEGHRLGRGRGYYDRFLARVPLTIYKIGLCFPWQLIDHVPTDDYDVAMDCVVSRSECR